MKKLKIKRSKIGSSWYDIEYLNEIKDEKGNILSGRIFETSRKILIDQTESYQKQLQTLFHEDLHGICWEWGINDIENMIKVLSNGLYTFIIDNPKFIREILKHTEEIKKC